MSDKPSADIVSLHIVPGSNYHAEADAILDEAKGKLRNVVLIGWDEAGDHYFRSTDGDADTNLLLDIAKQTLIGGICDED